MVSFSESRKIRSIKKKRMVGGVERMTGILTNEMKKPQRGLARTGVEDEIAPKSFLRFVRRM